jgi:hypothetical protein
VVKIVIIIIISTTITRLEIQRWTVTINSIEKIIIIKMVGAKRLVNPWVFWCAVEARSY